MAFTCGFYNSVNHDRKYDAVQHGMIFDGIITDGIYATYLKAMVVKASSNPSEVIVQPGRAWFNHTWSYNDADYPVAAPDPEVVLDRIDTLVLDINSEDAVRDNRFIWVQGTPTSQTPEPPALIHTATHNQYPLCDVYRKAGTTQIYAADITNRVGTSDCPFVTGVLESIDIDDLLAQWDDEFHTWENATKASFEGWMLNQQQVYTAWFNALKTQMAGDVADVEAWVQTIKDIIDEETATHLQLEIDEINSMLPSGSHITVTTSDTELYSRTVTITDEDNNTVTSQFDANGVAVFKSVPYVGNLTITSTDGVRTATEVVNTPYFARYEFTLAFWSATVNIIGDSMLGGDTVTITDSTTALVGTVVLNASGTGVFNATYPDTYKFSVTHGGETMEVSLAVTQETTYNVEIHAGLNYQAWLNAGRVSKSFSSLDEVLEDEKTLRQLFLVHDAVDYVASQRVNNDLTKIFNTDLAAKWINNSDYALEKFYAVADIKTVMDAADKYGYGEWVITDDTTTPPTWGPKGNVPVMTANTAPYGEAFVKDAYSGQWAYYPFDNEQHAVHTSNYNTAVDWYCGYKFANPIRVKRVYINTTKATAGQSTCTYKIQASNDNSTWVDISSVKTVNISFNQPTYITFDDISIDDFYLYYRVFTNGIGVTIMTLQFYGRELKVSVPTMTSNTAPFGVIFSSRTIDGTYPLKNAFDGNDSTVTRLASAATSADVGYRFTNPVSVRMVYWYSDATSATYQVKISYSDDGTTWTDTEEIYTINGTTKTFLKVGDCGTHLYWKATRIMATASLAIVYTLQFYGLDYSEKEFEVGTTKKWLYDHGVELVGITAYKANASNTAEKENNQLYLKGSVASSIYGFRTASKLDLSAYSHIRTKVGNKGGTASRLYFMGVVNVITDAHNSAVAEGTADIANAPNHESLSISSVNGSYFPVLRETNGDSSSSGSISEWWLE